MSLFDTLFPPRMRSPAIRRPSARTRATIRRHRDGAFGEQLEQRLALAVTFAPRFTIDAPGDITFAANTMMTAVEGQPGTATQVTNAQDGTGTNPNVWNDDFWKMQYINVDPTGGNFASSSADLSLPAGANVLFAGLYYGSRTNQNVSDDVLKTVKLKGPGDASYTTLSGAAGPNQVTLLGKVLGQVSNLPPNVQTYGAFANVTDLVFARGQGTYTIANIQGDPGIINHFAGWSLVVAYDAPGANLRNLSVFDGFADVSASNPNVEVNFTGFTAPPSGPVKANLGFVSYEGDLGIDNDTASFFGGISTTQLSNATNPANNFFNSSISTNGVTVTSKNPNYLNQLGFDADILNIDGKIANGATTAKLTLTSTQDQYYPAVVTSAIDLYAPKVSVDKSVVDVNGGIVEPGDTLRYTITVANDANAFDTAANVILNDAIPTFTTYKPNSLFVTAGANSSLTVKTDAIDADQAEALPTGATPPTTSVRFQLGTGAGGGAPAVGGELAKGESTTVTFEVTVSAGFPSEGFITNTAIVNYTSKFTGKPFSASDTASIQCPPVIDLAITKTSPGSQYVPGSPTNYSFTVTNNGPAASPGSIVTDTLPSQTTFNPAINPGWTLVGSTLSYVTPALVSGGSTSFALVLLPASDRLGPLVNTASVAVPPGFFDRNLSNNTATETDTAKPTVTLGVTKTDNSDTYVPGSPVTYTIVVSNTGPSALVGGNVTDLLPAVASSGTWTTSTTGSASVFPTTGGNNIKATVNIPKGDSVTFTYIVQTKSDATADLVNTVVVTPPAGQGSSTSSTDRDTATPQVNLTVTKTDNSDTYFPGSPVTYTIVVSNTGPSALVGGTVTDLLPAVATSGTWTTSTTGGASVLPISGGNNINATVNIPKGDSVTFTYIVQTKSDATADLVNTVVVTPPAGQGSSTSSTDRDTATPKVNLTVTKTDGSDTYIPGNPVTYTIVVTNTGPSALVGGNVTDLLPAVATSGTWTTSTTGGATVLPISGGNNINATVNIPKGDSVTFTYIVQTKSDATADLVNTVVVTPPEGQGSSTSSTDRDTATPQVDLAVTKTDGSDTYIPGNPVTYTIVVTNTGPSALVGGTVTDLLPAVATSGTWTTSTTGGATVLPISGGNNINATVNIPKGDSVTFTYIVQTKSDATDDLVNTVVVTPPEGQGSSTSSTDRDTATPQVDLAVTKTRTSPLPVIAGEIVTYSIVVTSNGPSSITTFSGTDVSIPDLLSPTYSVDTGTYNPNTGIWTANPGDTFDEGESVTFTFSGTVPADATGTLTNTVTGTPPIPDPNPDNNTSTATDTIVVKPVLSITKSDGKGTYVPGTSTTYTIIATNAGPSFLKGGTVSDPLPAQVASATWTAVYSAGSSGPESGSGPLNETVDLAPGGTATFQFTVQIKPDATGDLVNTVTITPPPNTQGNTATATDTNTLSSPQLLLNVTKTDGKTTYLPGQTFPYTIVVSNAGPSTMVDGVVNDPLPSQVATATWTASYTAGSSGAPSGSGGITNEKITLLPGGSATFTLTVTIRPDAFGQMDNIVTLTPPAGASVDPQSVLSATDINFGPEPPASIGGALVVGSDDGCNGPPWVRVLDPDSGQEISRFLAYDARFRGSVRVATGDVTGDGVAEIITAPGRNAIGEVRVFQQALGGWAELTEYRTFAFGPGYRGGVEVAVADIDGDLDNDIVTGMSIRTGMVNVFRVTPGISDPVANAPFKSFRGAPAGTNNGVMISAGDYILGGPAEIAVGTNSGTRALVRVFDVSGTPTVVRSFKPFANNFRGGVTLSTADYDGNGSLDLIVGAGLNGGSRVEVWNPSTGTKIAQTSAFSSLAKPNARVFAVFGSAADGFIGTDSTLYGVQGLNGGRGSKGVWKVLGGNANSLINSQGSLPPLRIAPIALPLG